MRTFVHMAYFVALRTVYLCASSFEKLTSITKKFKFKNRSLAQCVFACLAQLTRMKKNSNLKICLSYVKKTFACALLHANARFSDTGKNMISADEPT